MRSLRIHLLAGARPFERPSLPVRLAFWGHGVANLTLPSLAALIPSQHEVTLQDEQVDRLRLDAPMDLALITAKTCYAPRAYEIAARLRRRGVPVIIGGCHATLNPHDAAPHADAVVVGEVENLMPQLLDDVLRGRLEPLYQGSRADMGKVLPPRRDLLQKRYIVDAVQVSRGCSHACRFCCIRSLYGNGCRTRPVGRIIDEMRGLSPFLGFLDENLVADRAFARELFTAMIPLRKRWLAQVSADLLEEPDLIHLASRAGAQGFFFGFETMNQRNLEMVGKFHNQVDRYGELVDECHRAGVAVGPGMLFGLEADTLASFDDTLDALLRLDLDLVYLKIATPYPGTEWFGQLEAEGRILTHDWSWYDGSFPVFRPTHMTPRQLFEGVRRVREAFYSPRAIAHRIRRFRRLNLPIWAQLNMNRLARNAYRQAELLGEHFLTRVIA